MNQRKLSTDNLFITFDLALTVAMLVIGYPLQELDASDSRKTGFVFNDTEELQEAIRDYWNDQLRVNPRVYFNMLKDLKSRIYTRKRY